MKNRIIGSLMFMLLGCLVTCLLFHPARGFKGKLSRPNDQTEELQRKADSIAIRFEQAEEHWNRKSEETNNRVAKTEIRLSRSRERGNYLQRKVRSLILENRSLTDTSALVSNCDSIKQQTGELLSAIESRDSLMQSEISDLKEMIQDKDSALAACRQDFISLKREADSSLAAQNRLEYDLNLANRKMKQGIVKSKLLSAAILVFATATSVLALKK